MFEICIRTRCLSHLFWFVRSMSAFWEHSSIHNTTLPRLSLPPRISTPYPHRVVLWIAGGVEHCKRGSSVPRRSASSARRAHNVFAASDALVSGFGRSFLLAPLLPPCCWSLFLSLLCVCVHMCFHFLWVRVWA